MSSFVIAFGRSEQGLGRIGFDVDGMFRTKRR